MDLVVKGPVIRRVSFLEVGCEEVKELGDFPYDSPYVSGRIPRGAALTRSRLSAAELLR